MIELRRATRLEPDELAQLGELLVAVVAGGASVGFLPPLSPERAVAYWRGIGERVGDGLVLLLAVDGDRVVGAVQLQPAESENGRHRGEVAKLLVHPDRRRRGIGRALMERLHAEARAAGRTLLVLDTREGDPSNALYRGLGYRDAGRIPGYARAAGGALEATVYYYKDLLDGGDDPAVPMSGDRSATSPD